MLASSCFAAAPKAEIADARVRVVMPGRVYSASKHAVIALTKAAALEWSAKGGRLAGQWD